jgi:hypothetical protein
MKIQVNDVVKLVPSYHNDLTFKVVMANEHHLIMVDTVRTNQLWEAHPDDVEIIQSIN